jgi:hypothetical protein
MNLMSLSQKKKIGVSITNFLQKKICLKTMFFFSNMSINNITSDEVH